MAPMIASLSSALDGLQLAQSRALSASDALSSTSDPAVTLPAALAINDSSTSYAASAIVFRTVAGLEKRLLDVLV